MRYPLLVLSIFVMLSSPAQEGVRLFVRGGANITVHGDPLGSPKGPIAPRAAYGAGYQLGGDAEFARGGGLGLLLGITAVSRSTGYAFDESQAGYPPESWDDGRDRGERTVRCRLIELPVLLTVRRWSGLRVDAGLQMGRLISAKRIERGIRWLDGQEQRLDAHEDIRGQLAGWEGAVVAGIVVEGPHGLHAMLRYVHGLTNLDEGSGSAASYTRQLQVGLVYAWGWAAAQARTAM